MRTDPLFRVNPFRHCSTLEIRNVSELIAFAVANRVRLLSFFLFRFSPSLVPFLSPSLVAAVKLDRQTEKCIYERNV